MKNAFFPPGASAKGSSASAHLVAVAADFSGTSSIAGVRGSADNPAAAASFNCSSSYQDV